MATNIGQLLVELGVNTAAFSSGLDKATYQAKQFGKELKESFSEVGNGVRELIGEFGGISPALSSAMSSIASALEPFEKGIHSAGGALGAFTAIGAATGVAVIGLAAHAAEGAEKLDSLSQATGVSVKTLSGLGQVAAINGIGIDQLAKGLEKMGKSAFTAASAAPTASNAYKSLGIAVLDASGHMRDQTVLFEEIANKFSEMQDGGAKTALAMQIFGKAGAELIPVLNRGGAGIDEMVTHFVKLGAVMNDETAAAAEKVKENFTLLQGAFTGVQNKILTGLAPALSVFTDELVSGLEDSQSQLSTFLDGLIDAAKIVLNVFQILGGVASLIGEAFKFAGTQALILGDTLGGVYSKLKSGDIAGAWDQVKEGARTAAEGAKMSWTEALDSVKSSIGNVTNVWTAKAPTSEKRTGGADIQAKQPNTDFVTKSVDALERQATKEADLAQSIGKVSEASIQADAAATAHASIQALVDEATAKGVQNTQEFKNALADATPRIQEAAMKLASFKAEMETQKEFDSFDTKIHQQIVALQDQAAANTTVERQWAKNTATLVPLQEKLTELKKQYDALQSNPQTDPATLKEYGDKLDVLNQEYETEIANVNKLNTAFQQSKAAEEAQKITSEINKITGTLASLTTGDAFLNLTEQTTQWKTVLGLTDDQIQQLLPNLQKLRDAQITQGVLGASKQASGFDPKEANTLAAEIDNLKKNWQSLGLSAQEYSLTLQKLQAQQDDLNVKTGGFAAGAKAAFANFQTTLLTSGQLMQTVITDGLKGIGDNFAAMVTTGKAKWGDLINSMEQALLKSSINNILGSLFNTLGGALSGQGGFLGGLGNIFSGLTPHAMGGDVTPGKPYLVGENGPEIFNPGIAGSITPNDKIGGQTTHVHQNITIMTPDADSFRKSKSQIMGDMQAAGVAAARRNRM